MAKEPTPEIPVRFYRTEAGRAPVLDWLRSLDKADRNAIGWPLVGSLKDGLWEVARRFRASELPGSSYCTGSSRKRRKRLRMIEPWRDGE